MGETMISAMKLILSLSISGSLIALVLFALKPLVRNRLSKSFQYYIWLVVLLRFVLPLPFSFGINLMEYVPVGTPPSVEIDNSENTAIQARETVISENTVIPAEREYTIPYTPGDNVPTGAFIKIDPFKILADNMLWIWLAGAVISLAWSILSYLRFIRYVHGSAYAVEIQNYSASIYKSRNAYTPMLVGIIKPRIYLPDIDYTYNQLNNILLHELTHLRRRDVWLKWLAALVVSVHWFNPIVYVIRREFNHACELSCDEAVIRNLDSVSKQSYGDTLISVVAESRYSASVMSVTMCEEKNKLKERLLAIMTYRKKTKAAFILAAIITTTITVCAFAFGANVIETRNSPIDTPDINALSSNSGITSAPELSNTQNGGALEDIEPMESTYSETNSYNISLTDLRQLAEKGDDLVWEDSEKYEWEDVLSGMYNNAPQNINATYSPDGKYFIEGYGVDYNTQVSGLNTVKQLRIVEISEGKTVWSMDGLFLFNTLPPFVWSSDSRYVSIAYAGRTWMDGLVVDTADMSEQALPGVSELAPLLINTTPADNRPDPYIVPQAWSEHMLKVSFSWRVNEAVEDEDNRIYGEYMYNAETGEFTLSTYP